MPNWTYESRLKISLTGNEHTVFYDKQGNVLANGYTRIVIGDRGPYIEFRRGMINYTNWIETEVGHVYYREWRSRPLNVKAYYQLKNVNYADYVIGLFYISPFDLNTESGPIIEKIRGVVVEEDFL